MSEATPDNENPKPTVPMFSISGEPLTLPPDFAIALAYVVVEWSRLEDAIESDLQWMMQFRIVADLAKEPPRAFNKKLELWRRAVNTLFVGIPAYRNLVASVVPRAKEAARLRNHLVHGMWPLENPTSDGRFVVVNMQAQPNGLFKTEHLQVNKEGLEQLTAEILDIAGAVVGLTVTRMLHAHYGLLKGSLERAPGYPVHPSRAKEPKP